MFFGRIKELETLESLYTKRGFELLILYGRRAGREDDPYFGAAFCFYPVRKMVGNKPENPSAGRN